MDITGRTAFAQEASQINENLFNFRSDVDSVRSVNQELIQQSKTANATEVLKSVGQEVGVRTFNELLGKYGGAAYRYKTSLFGNRSLKDLDAQLGENIIDRTAEARDVVGKGLSTFTNKIGLPKSYDLNDDVISLQDMGIGYDGLSQSSHSVLSGLGQDSITPEMSRTVSESMITNPDSVYSDESFGTFMNNRIQELPRTQSGAIDFDSVAERQTAQQRDLPEDMGEGVGFHTHAEIGGDDALMGQASSDLETRSSSVADDTPQPEAQPEGLREQVLDVETGGKAKELEAEGVDSIGLGGLDTLGEEAGVGIAEGVGEVAGKEVAGTALEGIGTALDATGIFAPIGALFNVAGTALDVAGAVQVGKGVVDWFDEDILQKPMPSAPQIQLPTQPYTIAQRGMGIVPNMDSLNLPSSVSSSW